MKKNYLLFLFLLISTLAIGQTKPIAPHKLLGKGEVKIHGQFVPALEFSIINKKPALSFDVAGHAIYNQYLYAGLYYNGLVTPIKKNITYTIIAGSNGQFSYPAQDEANLSLQHYGFEFGYLWRSDQTLQLTPAIKIGTGKVELIHPLDYNLVENNVITITPFVTGHYMLNDWFKISAGIGYRYVQGVEGEDEYSLDKNSFNSPLVRIGLSTGWYNLIK